MTKNPKSTSPVKNGDLIITLHMPKQAYEQLKPLIEACGLETHSDFVKSAMSHFEMCVNEALEAKKTIFLDELTNQGVSHVFAPLDAAYAVGLSNLGGKQEIQKKPSRPSHLSVVGETSE